MLFHSDSIRCEYLYENGWFSDLFMAITEEREIHVMKEI